jgi:hypothetical protein
VGLDIQDRPGLVQGIHLQKALTFACAIFMFLAHAATQSTSVTTFLLGRFDQKFPR